MNIQITSNPETWSEQKPVSICVVSQPDGMRILQGHLAREGQVLNSSDDSISEEEIYSPEYLRRLLDNPQQVIVTCTDGVQSDDDDLRKILDALDSFVPTQIVRMDWHSKSMSRKFGSSLFRDKGSLPVYCKLKPIKANEFTGWMNDQLRTLHDWGVAYSEGFNDFYHVGYFDEVFEHLRSIRWSCFPLRETTPIEGEIYFQNFTEISAKQTNCPLVHQIRPIDARALCKLSEFFRGTKFPGHQWLEEKFWLTFSRGFEATDEKYRGFSVRSSEESE